MERGEKDEARGTLRRGATLASQCGAHHLVEVAGELLRAAGGRPRRLGAVGLESLTPAELRVVGLAAGGMTNQRIADTLYVTLKTVEGHLAKSYRKLGIESRRDLAGALTRDGGDGDGAVAVAVTATATGPCAVTAPSAETATTGRRSAARPADPPTPAPAPVGPPQRRPRPPQIGDRIGDRGGGKPLQRAAEQ